jgi:hypothetical protein
VREKAVKIMSRTLSFFVGCLSFVAAGWSQTPDSPLVKSWPAQRGVLQPTVGESSLADMTSEVSAEDLEAVQRLWEKLERKGMHERVRAKPLDQVPVSAAALAELQRLHPPSEVGQRGPGFVLQKNQSLNLVVPNGFSSTVNEPSVVASGGQVLMTMNWWAAASTDYGDSFTGVNPFSGPHAPPASGGFCCDQVAVHEPAAKTTFWLQQYINNATTGVQRINVDQGSDGTFECFYDITPQSMGFPSGNWPDYPDLAVSNGFLYHASNVFTTAGNSFSGAFVARYPLAQIRSCSAVPFNYVSPPGYGSFKLTQGAGSTMYFADHNTTASIEIFSWPDANASPTSVSRTVTAWSNAARVCPGPDLRDWCGFIDSRLSSAFVADGLVGFSWIPAQGGSFPFPHARFARFNAAGLALVDEPVVWSPSLAWTYHSAAVNANGDVGGTIMAGGGTYFPICQAYLADDTNGDAFSGLENVSVVAGVTGPGTNRSGDYLRAQAHGAAPDSFVGACYAYSATNRSDPHFVWFGRQQNLPVFLDGFESGDVSQWSSSVP